MLFYSPTFIVFLLVFLAGLWLFRGEARVVYCCIASYVFYGWWYPPYVVLLFALTVYAHVFTRIEVSSRVLFGGVVLLGLAPLAVFKYTGFVFDNLGALAGFQAPFAADWTLPIGISFISFTAIAYVVDSRNRVTTPVGNLWHTGLFISFFPQLIAGPILRANELMPQITRISLNPRAFKLAFLLFALGAFKKVGVADQLAPFVDQVYRARARSACPTRCWRCMPFRCRSTVISAATRTWPWRWEFCSTSTCRKTSTAPIWRRRSGNSGPAGT